MPSAVGFSIRFRGVVVALAFVVIAYAIYTAQRAMHHVYFEPELGLPQIVVQTEAPG